MGDNISGTTKDNINYTAQTYPCGFCGDGKLNYKTSSTTETCDPGLNSDGSYDSNNWAETSTTTSTGTTPKCKKDCSGYAPYCGDGNTDSGEDCDSDRKSSYTCSYSSEDSNSCTYCNMSCKTTNATGPHCKDGVVNNGEICDRKISTYSCYVDTSWTDGNDTAYGYDIYQATCNSGCKAYSKSGTLLKDDTTDSTLSGYTSLGKCP